MNLTKELCFAYLEEDNAERGFFRLFPVLTSSENVQEEAKTLYQDAGALRVIPDRNERGAFKDRMRAMNHFCLLDITPNVQESNKIRTNKNYDPDRGEVNRFIVFSDAVKTLPEHTFYQLLEGKPEDAAVMAAKAVTPLFMLRDGDTFYGPVNRKTPENVAAAEAMEAVLLEGCLPTGETLQIFCKPEPLPEKTRPAEPVNAALNPALVPQQSVQQPAALQAVPADAPIEVGRKLDILPQAQTFDQNIQRLNQPVGGSANLLQARSAMPAFQEQPREDAQRNEALGGIPLNRNAALRTSVPKPKNRLQEVVDSQWRVIHDVPPSATVSAGAVMNHVENPVEAACNALKYAWQYESGHQQIADQVLSLHGMTARLLNTLTSHGKTPLQQALLAQLNDLEAERLSVLVQIDRAKADLDQIRKDAIEKARKEKKQALQDLDRQIDERKQSLQALNNELNGLCAQQEALNESLRLLLTKEIPQAMKNAQLVSPIAGNVLPMSARFGREAEPAELLDRFCEALQKNGVSYTRNGAAAMLALMAAGTCVALPTSTSGSLATLIENVMKEMGWSSGCALQISPQQLPQVLGEGNTARILVSTLNAPQRSLDYFTIVLQEKGTRMSTFMNYRVDPWPVLPAVDVPFLRRSIQEPAEALSLAALKAKKVPSSDPAEVLKPVMEFVRPMSGRTMEEIDRFVAAAETMMEGGFAAALDWTILLYLLPMTINRNGLLGVLNEYPVSAAAVSAFQPAQK